MIMPAKNAPNNAWMPMTSVHPADNNMHEYITAINPLYAILPFSYADCIFSNIIFIGTSMMNTYNITIATTMKPCIPDPERMSAMRMASMHHAVTSSDAAQLI